MVKYYISQNGKIYESPQKPKTLEDLVWVDMNYPSEDEELEVENLINIETPTREEMSEIEVSSRLYVENGAIYTTATLVINFEKDVPESQSVTFIFKDKVLITVRYSEPRSFPMFLSRCSKQQQSPILTGVDVFIGITEAIIDRLSDALELIGRELDGTSTGVFQNSTNKENNGSSDLQVMLKKIGRYGDLNGKLRESLLTLSRQMSYLLLVGSKNKQEHIEDLETYVKDINALSEHTNYVSSRINLLLDAILGMINIEQNAIIKFFSVAAAVFLPPTLIASIYGMNFKVMPELEWPLGYPLAIALMLFSALGPYYYFRKKRWL